MKWLGFLLLVCPWSAEAACRQALAFGLDVSGSVDATEYRLQLDGLAAAFDDLDVRQAVFGALDARLHVAVYEWSTPGDERLLVNWTELSTPQDLAELQSQLRSTLRATTRPSTGLGPALLYGLDLLEQKSDCWKRTLDISGDGKANMGVEPGALTTFPDWLTINGLVVGADDVSTGDERQVQIGELVAYYRAEVIHGPEAFVEAAIGFEDYEAAMERKLLSELAVLAIGQLDVIPRREDQ